MSNCICTPMGRRKARTGDQPWTGTEKDETFRQGVITNVKDFVESRRTGKHINSAEVSVESNLTAIPGRMASCEKRALNWDEMLQTNHKLEAGLKR